MSSVEEYTWTSTSTISSVTVISTAATATITETVTLTITDAATSSGGRKRHAMPIEDLNAEAIPAGQTPAPKPSPPSLDPMDNLLAAREVLVRRSISTDTEWEYETSTWTMTSTYSSVDLLIDWDTDYEFVTDIETSYDYVETTVTTTTTVTTHVAALIGPTNTVGVDQQQHSTLSTGSIAGIAVGGVGGLAILGAVIGFLFYARRRRRGAPEAEGGFRVGARHYEDQAARASPRPSGGGGFGRKPPPMAMAMAMESSDAIPFEARPMMGTGPTRGHQGFHAPAPWKHESSPPPPFRSIDTNSIAPQHPGSTYSSFT